jgi:RNA recognition motif-containing protein
MRTECDRTHVEGKDSMAKNIYVGNLSWSTSEDQLREAFAEYGEVISARIITDRDTGRSRGFGFVEMEVEAEANTAIEALNGQMMDGRPLTVNEARPRRPRENRGGGGGYNRRY